MPNQEQAKTAYKMKIETDIFRNEIQVYKRLLWIWWPIYGLNITSGSSSALTDITRQNAYRVAEKFKIPYTEIPEF